MITKKRLQELINQRATIWHDDFGEIKLNEKCEILDTFGFDCKHQPIEGSILRFYYIYDNQLQYDDCDITELEENVEKARWRYEMSATRVDRLGMPMYEDVCDGCIYDITFIDAKKCKWQLVISDGGISLIDMSLLGRGKYWDKPTKENYISACEICLKLFREGYINE